MCDCTRTSYRKRCSIPAAIKCTSFTLACTRTRTSIHVICLFCSTFSPDVLLNASSTLTSIVLMCMCVVYCARCTAHTVHISCIKSVVCMYIHTQHILYCLLIWTFICCEWLHKAKVPSKIRQQFRLSVPESAGVCTRFRRHFYLVLFNFRSIRNRFVTVFYHKIVFKTILSVRFISVCLTFNWTSIHYFAFVVADCAGHLRRIKLATKMQFRRELY